MPGPDDRSSRHMLTALQTTHQHADAKAGVLAAVQVGLVGTAGAWSRQAVHAWERGGAAGGVAATLFVLFVCGMFAGAACLAAALRPRVLRPVGANRYSFAHLARAADGAAPAPDEAPDEAADRRELAQTVRFLAGVALVKFRCLTGAVACTAVMGVCAGLLVVLRPVLL